MQPLKFHDREPSQDATATRNAQSHGLYKADLARRLLTSSVTQRDSYFEPVVAAERRLCVCDGCATIGPVGAHIALFWRRRR
jgi:hypothetical protein